MRQKTSLEGLDKVAEVELIYHSKVKPSERRIVKKSSEVYQLLLDCWNKDTLELQEEAKVIYLNSSGGVLGIYHLSKGGMTSASMDPKLIFTAALKISATSIILAHNHPSGTIKPSKADLELTQKLQDGGDLLDIKVLDHLIITPDQYFSFVDEGLL